MEGERELHRIMAEILKVSTLAYQFYRHSIMYREYFSEFLENAQASTQLTYTRLIFSNILSILTVYSMY